MVLPNLLVITAAICASIANADVPTLTLPWTTYTATTVSRLHQKAEPTLWKFQNVRFGVPPTGTLRFAKPQSPTAGGEYAEPTGFPECHNVDRGGLAGTPENGYIGQPEAGVDGLVQTEDCLFLDVYVPDSTTNKSNLPVIVWFYGGAFVSGSKGANNINNPLYSGTGILDTAHKAGKDAILVVGNYRLGAFGWLGGQSYSQMGGLQNVGLYDQMLVLQWVQDNIRRIGGNPGQVSVWGESAGASSILHHLVAKTDAPLFNRALLQSPAFQWKWERDQGGSPEDVFQRFSLSAGCSGNLSCLQSLPLNSQLLIGANSKTNKDVYLKFLQFAFGPTVDGKLIPALPAQLLRSGRSHKIGSLAISHVDQEAENFVPKQIQNNAHLSSFVTAFMPEATMAPAREAILKNYDPKFYQNSARSAALAIIEDSTFNCNTRQLYDAYSRTNKVYMLYYAVFDKTVVGENLALHGTDLLPTFWNQDFDVGKLVKALLDAWEKRIDPKVLDGLIKVIKLTFGPPGNFACMYQNYLVSLAASPDGDPNALLSKQCSGIVKGTKTWPSAATTIAKGIIFGTPTSASYIQNAFKVQAHQVGTVMDTYTPNKVCDFWTKIAVDCIGRHDCGDLSQVIEGEGGFSFEEEKESKGDL